MYRWIFALVCFLPVSALAQTELDWSMLAEYVSYDTKFDDAAGYMQVIPEYKGPLAKLDSQIVRITGYILPLDTEGNQVMLSAFPYSACFFCGGAGRESVLELKLADPDLRFDMDDVLMFEGMLELNRDPFGLNYYLHEARVVKESRWNR
ncbi:MAG: DUF3299 domain-containing protein [Bacteroidota bacterium]